MWDKLNFFGWSKKKVTVQPVQRDISITLTNGDRTETIHRSPSGNKLASSSSANAKQRGERGMDDDESSEGSTSMQFGYKTGTSTRRNSSFSFSREPLDLPMWSNVTSPGFVSRLVQQASGNSPLKEFNDSLSHSPFRKSPYKDLTLGELPYVSYSRKPRLSTPAFPSPNTSFKTGASSSIYNRDRRKHARQGQVFVRIAPIDPSMRANVSISRKSTSPTSSPFPPRGSPRAGGVEPYRNEGLGGIPQQELSMRFNRLWPHSPGSPVPGPGRPSSPTSPSNIMEALVVGRKRTREQDTFYPPNATPPSMSPPTKISVGIGDTPVRPQMSKRVKFVGGPEGHDRPMMVPYAGIGGADNEPLSSESILEQMNQTEKRFLPDSTSTPYSLQKKPIRMTTDDHSTRKRRSQGGLIGAVEDEPRGEKLGRFCTCNDCYAEAAGILQSPSGSPNKSMSDEKGTNTGDGRSKQTCDKGVSTDSDQGEYFRGIFRDADRFKKLSSEEPEDKDNVMKFGKVVYTKDMHDKDKKKRIERYYRMLKLKPPESSIFDVSQTQTEIGNTSTFNGSATLNGTNNISGGFSFSGASAPQATSGTSPIAQTVTTSACPTITSPSVTGNSLVGSGFSSAAPAASTSLSFGTGNGGLTTPAPTTTAGSLGQGLFSSGTTGPQKSIILPPPITSTTESSTAEGNGKGGFNFSGSTTFGSVSAASTAPSFGGSTTTTSSAGFGFGASISSPPQTEKSDTGFSFGGSTKTTPATSTTASVGFSFGQANSTAPSAGGFQFNSGSTSVSFGQQGAQDVPDAGKIQTEKGNTTFSSLSQDSTSTSSAPAAPGFNFGGSSAAPEVPLFGGQKSSSVASTITTSACTTKTSSDTSSTSVPTGITGIGILSPAATSENSQSLFSSGVNTSSKATGLTTTATPGGFSFSNPSTTAPTFGTPGATATSPPSIFGGAGGGAGAAATTTSSTGFGFGSSFTSPSPAQSSTPGGFGFGGNTNPQPAASATTTASGGGFAFGQSTPAVTTAGAPSAGVFKFSQQANATAPTGTGSAAFQFGQTAPAASTLTSPTTDNRGTNPNNSLGQVVFPSVTNPLAKPKPSGLNPISNLNESTTSTTAGGFSFSTGASTTMSGSTFGSMTAASPSSIFGGGAASSTPSFGGGSTSNPPAFGGSATSNPPPFGASTTTGSTTFGGNATASNPPAFGGSATASNPPAFGGSAATSNPGGFGFGSSFSMSPPQSQSPAPSGGFGFGGNANPQISAPSTGASSAGFSFGQSNAPAAPAPAAAANTGPGVFQFGQQPSTGAAPGGGSGAFQFGQQAAQSVPGGFNFAAAASPAGAQVAVPGGPPMFNMGSTSTAPRRRDIRRRYR